MTKAEVELDLFSQIFGNQFASVFAAVTEIDGEKAVGMSGNSDYRAGPIKRSRMTKIEVGQLERQIYETLAEDHPQSVRHVFYRMTNPRLTVPVEKSERGYKQVQNRCTVMRREGSISFGWFADMTRRGFFTRTFTSAADFVMRMQGLYRADLWKDADYRCEVWVESRSIAGVLQDGCEEMAVDLYPCGGFPSMTFVYDAAQANNQCPDNRPLVVFYIGDYDPAGVLISDKLQEQLREHLRPNIDLYFERLAINADQIREYDLPAKPRKLGEKRVPHIKETVEAEAMPARLMRDLLRDAVENLLPTGALAAAQIAEQSEREHLVRMAEFLP